MDIYIILSPGNGSSRLVCRPLSYSTLDFSSLLLYSQTKVVFTNKRSQAEVFTVYLSLAARHKYLEDDNYNVALFTWSAESSQYTRISIYTPLTLASQKLAHPTGA